MIIMLTQNRHYSKCFADIHLLSPHKNFMKQILLLSHFTLKINCNYFISELIIPSLLSAHIHRIQRNVE